MTRLVALVTVTLVVSACFGDPTAANYHRQLEEAYGDADWYEHVDRITLPGPDNDVVVMHTSLDLGPKEPRNEEALATLIEACEAAVDVAAIELDLVQVWGLVPGEVETEIDGTVESEGPRSVVAVRYDDPDDGCHGYAYFG